MNIACIGSRDLNKDELARCKEWGYKFAREGYVIQTGNARGADQAFAEGANTVNPEMVMLFLPWSSYEKHRIIEGNKVIVFDESNPAHRLWMEEAEKHHPAWYKLSRGSRLLMARNIGIIDGTFYVVAFPKTNPFGQLGGTGQGIRYATSRGVPVYRMDLRREEGG